MLIDGTPTLACLSLAATVEDKKITTIEGLLPAHRAAGGEGADPLQEAFDESGALQCGFCQPGMILSAKALLAQNPDPSMREIKESLAGNLCRCTGYTQIYEAVLAAAKAESQAARSPDSAQEVQS